MSVDGRDECARCGHLRAIHGAPRYKGGMGCISTVKTNGARHGCDCPGFEEQGEFPTPGENPALTIDALRAIMLPGLSEGELPPVLPAVEDSSLALGDRVMFRTPLVRRMVREGERAPDDRWDVRRITRRVWVRGEHESWRIGYIIGKRTLQNGIYNWGGHDEQAYLSDIEYVPAYLIAYDLHQKPVRVLEDDIKKL